MTLMTLIKHDLFNEMRCSDMCWMEFAATGLPLDVCKDTWNRNVKTVVKMLITVITEVDLA